MTLAASAVTHAAVLRAIAAGAPDTNAALARAAGQPNDKTIARDVGLLERDGLITGEGAGRTLTEAGRLSLDAIAYFEAGGAPDGPAAPTLPPGVALLRVDQLKPGHNARQDSGLSAESIQEMADSIATVTDSGGIRGVLQPPTVRPVCEDGLHEIAFGHRRYLGWKLAVETGHHPADRAYLCPVFNGSERELRSAAMVENLDRSDMTNLEYGEEFADMAAAFNMDAIQIAKDVGKDTEGGRRWVQIALKVAREAAPENKALFRSGEWDWTRLRDSVGDKKPKPALQLTPKMTLSLVELADWCERYDGAVPSNMEPGYAPFQTPPTGGAFITLADRNLINLRPGLGKVWGKVLVKSTDAGPFLTQIGFDLDRDACLLKVRADVLGGELVAAQLAREGKYASPELVQPDRDEPRSSPSLTDQMMLNNAGRDLPAEDGPPPAALAPTGEAPQAPAGAVHPAYVMTDEKRLKLLEIAHKVEKAGITPTGKFYCGAAVTEGFARDGIAQQMVFDRLIGFMPGQSGRLIAVVQPAGKDYLEQHVDQDDIDDDVLSEAHEATHFAQTEGAFYATAWLNDEPPPAEAGSTHSAPPAVDAQGQAAAAEQATAGAGASTPSNGGAPASTSSLVGRDVGEIITDLAVRARSWNDRMPNDPSAPTWTLADAAVVWFAAGDTLALLSMLARLERRVGAMNVAAELRAALHRADIDANKVRARMQVDGPDFERAHVGLSSEAA